MTFWYYVGCELDKIPKDLISDDCMSSQQIKELLNTVPLIEGKLEATSVDAITALLLDDNIFPLKIHPLSNRESNIDRLKSLVKNIKYSKKY